MLRMGVVLLFCLFCAVAGAQEVVDIEGKILVSSHEASGGPATYFLETTTASKADGLPEFAFGDVSPYMDRVAYAVKNAAFPTVATIETANIDGSGVAKVTEMAGVGGVNCRPQWSPDASMIAFQHADPGEGEMACEVGFSVWVVKADGSFARQVTPGSGWNPTWSPNGYRVTCRTDEGAAIVDTDGSDFQVLPNVADMPDWSPCGSNIASCTYRLDVVGGEPGVWRELLLTDVDGGNPVILVARFVTDKDIDRHLARDWPDLLPGHLTRQRVRVQVGPSFPEWSPSGDRLIYYGAMPFDPDGLWCEYQVEMYVYDLKSSTSTRITENEACEYAFSWNGDNTFPADPVVEVDDLTVTFDTVTEEGVTTIVRDDDPPEFGTGFQFGWEFYEIDTTAAMTGPVTVCFSYHDAIVPSGTAEADLAIFHWDEDIGDWVDATVSHDLEANVICAVTDSLSPFAVHGVRRTRFPDVPAWGFGPEELDAHWAYEAVEICVRDGVVRGYPDGFYRPLRSVQRDQMAVFIARSLAGGDAGVSDFEGTPTFPDVSSTHWALDYVEYAVASDVVGGYEDGTYRPSREVTRGQMAIFVARVLAGGEEKVPAYSGSPTFADVGPDFWAFRHVEYIRAAGVIQGYGDGLYHPEYVVTRDQMAVYIARSLAEMDE